MPPRFVLWFATALIFLVGILVSVQVYWLVTRTTEEDVRELIENNLENHATADEIIDFLDSEDIDHSGVRSADFNSTVLGAGYPPDTNVIAAIIRGTSKSFFGEGDISIDFILDSSLRMETYIVQEGFTSL